MELDAFGGVGLLALCSLTCLVSGWIRTVGTVSNISRLRWPRISRARRGSPSPPLLCLAAGWRAREGESPAPAARLASGRSHTSVAAATAMSDPPTTLVESRRSKHADSREQLPSRHLPSPAPARGAGRYTHALQGGRLAQRLQQWPAELPGSPSGRPRAPDQPG